MNTHIRYLKNLPALLGSVVLFSACLKDTPYMDVSHTQPIIEFGLSPASGNNGPFLWHDSAYTASLDTAISLVVASPQVLPDAVTATVAIDTSQISAYNNANSTSFVLLPFNMYSLPSTSIVIAAQHRIGSIPVTLHFNQFPAVHNYALPLVIVKATQAGGAGLIVSGNSGTFMWLLEH